MTLRQIAMSAADRGSRVASRLRKSPRGEDRAGEPSEPLAAQGFQLPKLRRIGEQHKAWVLHELEVNVVLDVGANLGQYARSLRQNGYTGRIVSFEPVPHTADKLEKRAARDPDWQVMRYALGDRDETARIHLGVGQGRLSSLLPATEFGRSWDPRIDAGRTASVEVRRLDGLFDQAVAGVDDPRVFLKLDTQGFDLKAFAGAGDRTADLVGMQSEVSQVPLYEGMPHLTDQLATYAAAGFGISGLFPVVVDRPTMQVIEFDAVMVRTDRIPKPRDGAAPAGAANQAHVTGS